MMIMLRQFPIRINSLDLYFGREDKLVNAPGS
jgi:hypothetical protein